LVDEAEKQLEDLKGKVQGQVTVAHNDLQILETDFRTITYNEFDEGGITIEQEQTIIVTQINQIKDFANTANKDISSCVDVRQELLDRLSREYTNLLRNCLFGMNREGGGIISSAMIFIDVVINKVRNLEFQFGQFREDLFCISPLITEIELDKIRLPQNIKSEVSSAEGLLTRLKLSVIQCSDDNISGYINDANAMLQDIIGCADKILG
jgi:hypothetical protein